MTVATALTVYGIETRISWAKKRRRNSCNSTYRLRYWNCSTAILTALPIVATALTVYGIETLLHYVHSCKIICWLQQHLPFTVLKLDVFSCYICILKSCNSTYRLRYWNCILKHGWMFLRRKLQQHLPFTVLKHTMLSVWRRFWTQVATALTVYGIETIRPDWFGFDCCCNSTYRLRYWNNT